jgi:hypothetical protein
MSLRKDCQHLSRSRWQRLPKWASPLHGLTAGHGEH